MEENKKELHDHEEHHHHHHDHEGGTDKEKLLALMKYMSSHNADHNEELEHLAQHVRESGNDEAYELTMEAVRLFSEGNEILKKALSKME